METELFEAFKKFVNSLQEYKGSDAKSIKLYHHLLTKITPQHGGAISRNVELLKDFLRLNEEAIISSDLSLMKTGENVIKYSDKVFIDIKNVLETSDSETQSIIWKHLLTLKIKADDSPNTNAIEQLKKLHFCNDCCDSSSLYTLVSFGCLSI